MAQTVRLEEEAGKARFARNDLLERAERPRSRWIVVRTMPYLVRVSMVVLIASILIAILAPLIAPHDPLKQSLLDRLQDPSWTGEFPLGTDQLGRDVLSRVIYGARVSLGIAVIGMLIGLIIGTSLGVFSGFRGGAVDNVIMFLVDVQQAVPFIVLSLAVLAIFGTDLKVLIAVVGFRGWETFARFARGMTLSARQSQYVLASQAIGASQTRLIVRHVLPNVAAPLIVLATLNITGIILLESSLSFLGIGVQPPQPSWGNMIGEGREYLNSAWWIGVMPGVVMVVVTTSVNLVGDWLRDVLDPTLRQG